MFVNWIFRAFIKSSAILTFSNRCTRSFGRAAYRPNESCERISRRWMRAMPSERSVTRLSMCTFRALSLLLSLRWPGQLPSPGTCTRSRSQTYHFPNVFSWTLTLQTHHRQLLLHHHPLPLYTSAVTHQDCSSTAMTLSANLHVIPRQSARKYWGDSQRYAGKEYARLEKDARLCTVRRSHKSVTVGSLVIRRY